MAGSGDSIVKGLIEIYDEATLLGWLAGVPSVSQGVTQLRLP